MPYILNHISGEKGHQHILMHVQLGYHPDTNDILFVKDCDRFASMYIVGTQGNGKSGLIENLVSFDASVGNAIIVVDPHGDLTNNCLSALPQHRLAHTYVLDIEDETYPFGVNVFAVGKLETSIAQAQAVDRLMHIFEVLWADVLSQQHLPRYLRAPITFLANRGATLVDMHAFLLRLHFLIGCSQTMIWRLLCMNDC